MFDKSRLDTLPDSPGVYLMKGSDGTILYVGKAKSLRKRVRSYFGAAGESRYHIRFLVARVAEVEVIVTDTEKEALILENTLIKKHRPRYNLDLRDDKTYFSLRMDMNEEFPRLTIIRKVLQDGARYFGPYSSAASAREALKQLYRLFPLRHYPLETCRRRRRPCLFHQLRQCSAPCHGLISPEEYQGLVQGAALFLDGKNRDLLKANRERMASAAANERYEEAARYRDLIRAIEVTVEKQKMVTTGGDADVLGMHREGSALSLALLFIRGGRLIGSRSYLLAWELEDEEAVSSFLNDYYSREVFIPDEVLVPLPVADSAALAELLSERRGKRTGVTHPQRGTKADLVKLAGKNAEAALRERQKREEGAEAVLTELKERLHLRNLPRRIECYDISNIQGTYPVGSRVSFRDGKADKGGYRHYQIKTVAGADDFAMMHEVLSRRFRDSPAKDEHPDLIVVDGGIGQLNILTAVLRELQVEDVDAASLAKSRVERDMAAEELTRSTERVFLPGRKNPVVLRQNSAPLLLMARIRDEAHRFAITYHQKLRGKDTIRSTLDTIPGIGPKRRKELLRQFGSLRRIREASRDELAATPTIPPTLAESIWKSLHENDEGGTP
ncbi:excinuclease ABC subunit UvrC [Geobacter hydrogenophilus]|uniref:UvrABC system protein C n=1 Tax=Geobacter hydrogenophilus TaxID=40983 RepID=A0A9W6FZH0_9BACT|nr:excinuclease ABC subunit UvrC [Geobacter hydrogenophilus]MBT0893583.1 excinuclease ABC subunit UvrC [Geobacter hydrogenophilus]GLI37721.1 UvrABC system protein C [Geobacter hydrogenophilus]